jgi:hypothetical protein
VSYVLFGNAIYLAEAVCSFSHPSDDEPLERIPQSTNTQEDPQSVIRRFGIDPSAKLTSKEWLMQRLSPTYSSRKNVT